MRGGVELGHVQVDHIGLASERQAQGSMAGMITPLLMRSATSGRTTSRRRSLLGRAELGQSAR